MRHCEICNSTWEIQKHHKYPQHKWVRKLYGKLLDDPRNIQMACTNCHASHASLELIHWSEIEFCKELGIEPRSKQYRLAKA